MLMIAILPWVVAIGIFIWVIHRVIVLPDLQTSSSFHYKMSNTPQLFSHISLLILLITIYTLINIWQCLTPKSASPPYFFIVPSPPSTLHLRRDRIILSLIALANNMQDCSLTEHKMMPFNNHIYSLSYTKLQPQIQKTDIHSTLEISNKSPKRGSSKL